MLTLIKAMLRREIGVVVASAPKNRAEGVGVALRGLRMKSKTPDRFRPQLGATAGLPSSVCWFRIADCSGRRTAGQASSGIRASPFRLLKEMIFNGWETHMTHDEIIPLQKRGEGRKPDDTSHDDIHMEQHLVVEAKILIARTAS